MEIREAGLSAADIGDLLSMERDELGFVGVLISMEIREVGLEKRLGDSMLKVEEAREKTLEERLDESMTLERPLEASMVLARRSASCAS